MNYKKQVVNEEVFRNLLQAKDYINNMYLKPINLEDLTKIALISKYAFIRLFKTTFGVTPYHYILQKRLFFAKNELLKGEKVSDVALIAGFADTPTFSKAFKGYFGVSPVSILK